MQRYFFFFLISSIALAANSCGKDEDEPFFDVDDTAPVIAEVTAVTTPTNDNTPNYTFSSTEAGAIAYGGSCSSSTMSAEKGNNTITLYSLSDGTYSDCTIKVTDTAGNESNTLTMSTFYVDSTASTLVEVTAVTSSTNDNTPDYTFVSSEAGTITYSGSCSSSTTSATAGTNTITFNTLSDGTYPDCKITITDSLGNAVTLNIGSFDIDTTAPAVSSISPTDNQTGVSLSDNISVTFSDAMDTTSVTTNTDNTTCYGSLQLSSSNFSTCVQMSSSPSSSNSVKTFTLDPSDDLTAVTTYKTRVTTGVKDTAGNTLSSQYETSSGFTTSVNLMGGSIQGTDLNIINALVTTLSGSGTSGSANGTGTSASFYLPSGITTDGTNLYVSDDYNHLIRKIVISTGAVTTLAGTGSSGSANGTGTSASFNNPRGITTDGTNLYVGDSSNHLIRKIVISTGAVTTVAGTGSSGSANGIFIWFGKRNRNISKF